MLLCCRDGGAADGSSPLWKLEKAFSAVKRSRVRRITPRVFRTEDILPSTSSGSESRVARSNRVTGRGYDKEKEVVEVDTTEWRFLHQWCRRCDVDASVGAGAGAGTGRKSATQAATATINAVSGLREAQWVVSSQGGTRMLPASQQGPPQYYER
jgi:hypothetical protein